MITSTTVHAERVQHPSSSSASYNELARGFRKARLARMLKQTPTHRQVKTVPLLLLEMTSKRRKRGWSWTWRRVMTMTIMQKMEMGRSFCSSRCMQMTRRQRSMRRLRTAPMMVTTSMNTSICLPYYKLAHPDPHCPLRISFIRMSQRLALIQQRVVSQQLHEVYIVAAKRTPIATYMGSFSPFTGPELSAITIKAALESIALDPNAVDEVILGNVLSAGVGQAPARQAALLGGLPTSVTCTTINKVCSSGMKSIVFGAQSIALGHSKVVVSGGFESMSNAPHMIMKARSGVGHGDRTLVDHLTHEGLTDPFKHISMGLCAQKTVKEMSLTRKEQDEYCIKSFERHISATNEGILKHEIVPVAVPGKKKQTVDADQQRLRFKADLIPQLKPAFEKNGTVTSANASKINDGACSLILMSAAECQHRKVKPLAKIVAYADFEMESVDFCRAPYHAAQKALSKANLTVKDIDYFEFNEAFSVVPIVMMKLLEVPVDKINVLGGAVAMGHPIGMSGARIVQTLITVLKLKKGRFGLAAICNGGGGSTAVIIENVA